MRPSIDVVDVVDVVAVIGAGIGGSVEGDLFRGEEVCAVYHRMDGVSCTAHCTLHTAGWMYSTGGWSGRSGYVDVCLQCDGVPSVMACLNPRARLCDMRFEVREGRSCGGDGGFMGVRGFLSGLWGWGWGVGEMGDLGDLVASAWASSGSLGGCGENLVGGEGWMDGGAGIEGGLGGLYGGD